jgi:acyl dehydratase
MLILETPSDFLQHVGCRLGTSEWFTVEQAHIDDFARLTGDDFWIHVDQQRAVAVMPGGKTIAHGLFTLSLVPKLQREIFQVERRGVALFYGTDRVRFTAPVPVGSRIRLHQTLKAATRVGAATRLTTECEIEIEAEARPALVALWILLMQDS